MARDLQARLRRIRAASLPQAPEGGKKRLFLPCPAAELPAGFPSEWTPAARWTLRREIEFDFPRPLPQPLPPALGILVPDMGRRLPELEELLFFDLETTGLSGGAGTVAFLAAFGRFVSAPAPAPARLRIEQYLLLDYPGEYEFLQTLLPHLSSGSPVAVTYNGKTFDAPLLTTRCRMTGIEPPGFAHADLLHPARRLWKRLLPSCSQAVIETAILGLDRDGDLPGAMAPEMWFSFLRTGECQGLLEVCGHNARDILGLAHLFALMAFIALDPVKAAETVRYDIEALALRWRRVTRRPGRLRGEAEDAAGRALMEAAFARGYPRPGYALCRALAVDAEWRQGDIASALAYTRTAISLEGLPLAVQQDLSRRLERLIRRPGREQ
ncbi:MAG: ribonuclease H-like domain-containing protein [Treponema sp.]|jgi:uncharacterized protein YprB with RNaseH-like and TPR domain|nr:ribonuclease H-like domain-containing protein [Treponema sp.]